MAKKLAEFDSSDLAYMDIFAVEKRASELRAQELQKGFQAFVSWVKGLHLFPSKPVQSAK